MTGSQNMPIIYKDVLTLAFLSRSKSGPLEEDPSLMYSKVDKTKKR